MIMWTGEFWITAVIALVAAMALSMGGAR